MESSQIPVTRYQTLLRIQFGTLIQAKSNRQDTNTDVLTVCYPDEEKEESTGQDSNPVFYFRVSLLLLRLMAFSSSLDDFRLAI